MRDRAIRRGLQATWAPIRHSDDAVCEFAVEYADQNLRDYRRFVKAIREDRIPVAAEG